MPRPSKVGTAQHVEAQIADFSELDRVVLARPHRLGNVLADLGSVDIERSDEFNVAYVVVTEFDVHESRNPEIRVCILVVLNALDEGVGAVSEPCDGYFHLGHRVLLYFLGGRSHTTLGSDETVEPGNVCFCGLHRVLHEGNSVAVLVLCCGAGLDEDLPRGLELRR